MASAEQVVVQHALSRGFLTQEQLRALLLLQHRLSSEGRPTALLPLLGRVLRPEHLPELTRVYRAFAPTPLPPAATVAEATLLESHRLARRPPEEDPEPVRRFLAESRRGGLFAPTAAGNTPNGIGETATSTRPQQRAPQALAPERVGQYRLVRELGRGGMGTVYEAHAEALDRRVALKLLRPGSDEEDRQRFLLEARAAARLRHPAIVVVHEVGEADGVSFIAMDLVQGPSLKVRIQAEGPLPPAEAARIALRIAQALETAHARGILHRDVKPHNVLLDAALGEAVLSDFGLAKELGKGEGPTATGQHLGTPAYMSPEQAQGIPADVRADVWGLGATLYEMLAGRPPFRAETALAVLHAVVHEEVTPPSRWRAGLPRDLETVCLMCLERDPARRYPGARELAADLTRFLADEPVSGRRSGPLARARRALRRSRRGAALAALLGLLLLAGAGLLIQAALARGAERAASAERAALVGDVVESALAGRLESNEALTAAVFQLARLPGDEALERLARELDLLTGELRQVELEAWREVVEPDELERARGESRLEGVPEALARRAPGELLPPDQAGRAALSLAARRMEARSRRGAPAVEAGALHGVGLAVPDGATVPARELIARRQTARMERRAALASLACQTLARIGKDARASRPLIAYLAAEADAVRAAQAGVALTRLGGEEGFAVVLASLRRFGDRGGFAGPVKRALAQGDAERALPGQEADVRALLLRGELREVAHDLAGALAAFDEALALDPRCAEAWRRRGELRLARHDPRGALADCGQAIELDPGVAQAWVARARTRIELRDLDGALSDASRAVELGPADARTWRCRARVRRELGDARGAVEDIGKALELDPRDAVTWAARGEARHELDDPQGALADLERALEISQEVPSVWAARARIRFERRDFPAALSDWQRALELDPGHAIAWVNRGATRFALADLAGAREDYDKAIELDPRLAQAWEGRAKVHLMSGKHREAVADCDRALELRPDLGQVLVTRSAALLLLGQLDQALVDAEKATRVAPGQAESWANRAAVRYRRGDPAGAVSDYDRAIELEPRRFDLFFNRGLIRREAGDERRALEDFGRAIGLEPGRPEPWLERGKLRSLASDLEGAREDLIQAVKLDTTDPDAYCQLGMVLLKKGELEEAERAFTRALELNDRLALAWGMRAGGRVMAKRMSAALDDYERFLQLAPDHEEAPAVRALLEEHGRLRR